jgi:hypothetical protein
MRLSVFRPRLTGVGARTWLLVLGLAAIGGCGAETSVVTHNAEAPNAVARGLATGDAEFCGTSFESSGFAVTVGPDLDLCCQPNDIVRVALKPLSGHTKAGVVPTDYAIVRCDTPLHVVTVVGKADVAKQLAPTADAIAHSAVQTTAAAADGETLEIDLLSDETKSVLGTTFDSATAQPPGASDVASDPSGAAKAARFLNRLFAGLVVRTEGFLVRRKRTGSWAAVALDTFAELHGAALASAREAIKARSETPELGIKLGPHTWIGFKDPSLDLDVAARLASESDFKAALRVGTATYGLGGTMAGSAWQTSLSVERPSSR